MKYPFGLILTASMTLSIGGITQTIEDAGYNDSVPCLFGENNKFFSSTEGWLEDEMNMIGHSSNKLIESIFYNLNQLERIKNLKENWNDNGAKPFSFGLVRLVERIIKSVRIPIEIFPTACDTIQMECSNEDGEYLEVQISEEDSWNAFLIDKNKNEMNLVFENDIEALNRELDMFYGLNV